MANIHDTLHPVTSPSDNLYPNINPVVNIPDESIPKRKMAFPIDSNGVTALIPTDAYVDIADLGIPGQVRFPSGTRYVYVQGGDVIVTPDLGEDKIYGSGVTSEWKFEIIVYSKNSDSYIATRFNVGDNPVGSVEDDDFVVLILMLSPVETGPQVIPIYSIIPFEFIKYNTQPYEKLLAQTMGIATIDGSYADLGAGKDGDGNPISTTYAKQTGNYPDLEAGKDGAGNVITETYAKQTGSYADLGAGKDGDGNPISTTYAKQTGNYPDLEAGKDGAGNVITETYAKQTGSYAELGAGKDSDGNVIVSTYAKVGELSNETQLRTAADQAIMALIDDIEDGTTTVAKAARIVEVNGLSTDDLNEFFGANYYGKIYWWAGGQTPVNAPPQPNGGALIIKRIGANAAAQIYITHRSSHETAPPGVYMRSKTRTAAWSDWKEIVTDSGVYENLGAGKDGDGNVISETYAKKSDIPTATRQYQHNVTIKNGDDAIITTTVLTSTSDVFSSVDDLITILGNAGFSVSSGPKLLPACGTVITTVGDTSVVYPVVGVGKYGNRVDGIGFYYFRSDVSVGRTGYQVLLNSNITYFNDTITQL